MSSRVISGIFDAKEPEFSHRIHDLEKLSGKNSHDIRVTVDLLHHFKQLAADLNLDRNDTTPKELYHSLRVRVLEDSSRLAEILHIKQSDTPRQAVEKCAEYLEEKVKNRKFWCIKQSVLKKQLKTNPPKRVMKILGFRSIDSLLKREPATQTLILAKIIENHIWHKKYIDQASAMTNSDFDEQSISIKTISQNRLTSLKKNEVKLNRVVFSNQESADIVIAVPSRRFEGDVMFYFDAIINHINGIIDRSAFYRFKGLRPDFFVAIKSVRENGFKRASLISWPIRWSTIAHSIQHKGNHTLADRLDLNVYPDDLIGLSVANEIDGFDIWKRGLAYGDKNGSVLSTNISDVILNAINRNNFENSYSEFGKNRLYDELFSRYLTHEGVVEDIFNEDDF